MAPPRRQNQFLQEFLQENYNNAESTVTRTDKVIKLSRKFTLNRVTFVSAAGLAEDAGNYYVISIKNGSTVMASWSTQTGQEGDLPVNGFIDLVLTATPADLTAAAGAELDFQLDLTGTRTMPEGHLRLEGRYL